jgi:dTDP-4-dehydrorhamnose reductase
VTKILVVGASGMLGFALHRSLTDQGYEVCGTVRELRAPKSRWTSGLHYKTGVDVSDLDMVRRAVEQFGASHVINAAGVIKQVAAVKDESALFRINSAFPRRLEQAGECDGFRLLHFSTDCVFAGNKGGYRETDIPDADDAYGVSKLLGEVGKSALTLRTSIIGLGLVPNASLVDWFLGQSGTVRAFHRAFFTGLPVNAIARFIGQDLLPKAPELTGLFHLAAPKIDKASLLALVARCWGLDVTLAPDDSLRIDRSLSSSKLQAAVPHDVADWPALIDEMHDFYMALGSRATENG